MRFLMVMGAAVATTAGLAFLTGPSSGQTTLIVIGVLLYMASVAVMARENHRRRLAELAAKRRVPPTRPLGSALISYELYPPLRSVNPDGWPAEADERLVNGWGPPNAN